MRVVITLFNDSSPFQPITRDKPVGLLTCLNKPLLERRIIEFVEIGLSEIIVVAVENPQAVQESVGPQTRWGAKINLQVFKDPCSPQETINRISDLVGGPLLLAPCESVINVDYLKVREFQKSSRSRWVSIVSKSTVDSCSDARNSVPCAEFVVSEESTVTGALLYDPDYEDSDPIDFMCEGTHVTVADPKSLWVLNMAVLEGRFPRILSMESSDPNSRISVGHHTKIDRTASIEGPVLIGNYVRVLEGAKLKPYSAICDGCIIDREATVGASVIMENTYVGAETSLEMTLAQSNFMIHLGIGVWTTVADPFLLSGAKKKIIYSWKDRVVDFLATIFLLIIFSPVLVIKGVLRKIRGKPVFDSRTIMIRDIHGDPSSADSAVRTNIFWFNDSGPLISRLPALLNVLTGRLKLVGVRPLSQDDFSNYTDDWTRQRFEAPDGLFTPIDAEAANQQAEDEKIAIENYYTVTRNFREDIKTLFKAIFNLVTRG